MVTMKRHRQARLKALTSITVRSPFIKVTIVLLEAWTDKARELKKAKNYAQEHPDDPAAQRKVDALQQEVNALAIGRHQSCSTELGINQWSGYAKPFGKAITGIGSFALRPDVVFYGWFCIRGSSAMDIWLNDINRQME